VEDRLGVAGDGGGGAREWPGKAGRRAREVACDTWTSWIFYLETEERGILGWRRAAHQRYVWPPGRPLPSINESTYCVFRIKNIAKYLQSAP
jgi:hypothetical protein